jgi:hypothetical protein
MKTFKIIFKDMYGIELYTMTLSSSTFEEAYEIAETHMCNVPDDSCEIEVTEIQL